MAEQCLKETRTISHLLHPPLLDEAGLESAIRWYVDGFGQRSGIKVNFDVPPDLGRFRRDIETALFRVVQDLSGHLKTGQRWSGQNRPTRVAGTLLFYPAESCDGKSVFVRQLRGPHLSTCP